MLFNGIPRTILVLGQGNFLGLGITVWLTLALAVVMIYFLEYTPLGRQFYAVGGSERVAFLAGIRTGRLKIASFAGGRLAHRRRRDLELGQSGAANAGFGPDLLLPAYAAAFLSVTTYRPGYYNVPGAVIAILLLAVGFKRTQSFGSALLGTADLQRLSLNRRRYHSSGRESPYQKMSRSRPAPDAKVSR